MIAAVIAAVVLIPSIARLIALFHQGYMEWTASGRAGRWTRREPT